MTIRPLLRFTATGLVALGFSLLLSAPGEAQRFEEATTVTAVEVPVQVLVDGRPVRDLTAEDFEIVDGRKTRPIVGFERIDLTAPQPTGPEAAMPSVPGSARRHFLLLFDLSFSEVDSVERAQEAARKLVQEKLHPSDLVSVATYSEARGLQMVLGFTPDRQQVEYALETLGLVDPLEKVSDPMGFLVAELEADLRSGGGGKLGGIALENLRDQRMAVERATREQKRAQIYGLTESIKSLGRLLDSVPGRVQIMFLSEGFDSSILLGNEGATNADRERIQEVTDQAARGEIWNVDSDELFGSTAARSAVEDMTEELRRSDTVIQAIDIGGLRAESDAGSSGRAAAAGARENSLFIMANETGGELFRNTNDLDAAMGDLLDRTSVTYILAFQPQDLEPDGSYHRIKVRLKNGPRNAQVVHRPGYYAPRPYGDQSPMERRLSTAGLIIGGRDGGAIDTAALAVPVATGESASYVPVLIEIEGESLLAGHREDALPLEIYAYAIESSGSIRDFFTRGMTLDLAAQGPALRQHGLKFWGHLYLDPGEYVLRVVVRDGLSGDTGVSTAELTVPDGAALEAQYPPLVPEPIGRWVLLRDDLPDGKSPPYPFMMGDQPFVPAARPTVEGGARTEFCLFGSAWRDAGAAIKADLIEADGTIAGSADVELGEPAGACLRAAVRMPTLEPGTYRLETRLESASKGEVRSPALAVRVSG